MVCVPAHHTTERKMPSPPVLFGWPWKAWLKAGGWKAREKTGVGSTVTGMTATVYVRAGPSS